MQHQKELKRSKSPHLSEHSVERDARALFAHGLTDPRRKDLRALPICTIDPEDAQDFDDALSARPLANGNIEVGIHIADVTHFVPFGSILDTRAREKGTSVYLVGKVLPMLPEIISNDLCSLRPKEDRLTFSVLCEMTKTGQVVSTWFGKTIIHSRKRFTYKEAQSVLDTKNGVMYKELSALLKIARILRKGRMDAGGINFNSEEVHFTLNKEGNPIAVHKKEQYETMELVEELMLLANKLVAQRIEHAVKTHKGLIGVYRTHDAPNGEKLFNLERALRPLGYKIHKHQGTVSALGVQKTLRESEGRPEQDFVHMCMLRSMAKAVYAHKNTGHFGLGFRTYTHFTSPIRRYPDMCVHRILDAVLSKKELRSREREVYRRACVTCTEQEINAQEMERDSIKNMQTRYWSTHHHTKCSGAITGIIPHGIFVRDAKTRAEAFIHISKLNSRGFLTYDQSSMSLASTHDRFRLGDTISFTITHTNIEKAQIDAELIG